MDITLYRRYKMPVTFADREPDVYKLEDIYDPEIHGTTNTANGKFIPAVGSIVVDLTTPTANAFALFVVVSVNDGTHLLPYQCTLKPIALSQMSIIDKLFTYGNDAYMLYYDTRTDPTTLSISSNLMLLGDNSSQYILYKHELDGTKTPLSINRDSGGNITGNYVPIVETASPGVRRPNHCETTLPLNDNDLVTMEVYDSALTKNMDIILISKRATTLNDLNANNSIITGFDVSCNQEKVTGEFKVFPGQNKDDLAIFPKLTFSTGEELIVPVDDAVCFMYGWENINTDLHIGNWNSGTPISLVPYLLNGISYTPIYHVLVNNLYYKCLTTGTTGVTEPVWDTTVGSVTSDGSILWERVETASGMEHSILFKYYLSDDVQSDISNGTEVRWVECTKTVIVESTDLSTEVGKINIIPIWNGVDAYTFEYIAYPKGRSYGTVVTNVMEFSDAQPPDGTSSSLGIWQTVRMRYPLVDTNGIAYNYRQDIQVKLEAHGGPLPNYSIRDNISSPLIFGAQDSQHDRPAIKFDGSNYFVSNSRFPDKDDFVENFFLNANAPWVEPGESICPEPTHFMIRRPSSLAALTVDVIAVEDYDHNIVMNSTTMPIVGDTLLVEFLLAVGGGYATLYGVPVEVTT